MASLGWYISKEPVRCAQALSALKRVNVLLDGSAHGTDAGASAALDAQIGVDYVLVSTVGDRADGALALTGAASDTVAVDHICHEKAPP